ncbi:MAG: hypothetical protein AUH81_10350 [Candidatus Rokubacteria bacterium 13_1_40CM_4_69_5]|nr:MAG: hypothetical protein AUH81_10350 [Candidatus Rokubacteria bacterium 13_1_40CM_4_69_5]
MKGWRMLLDDCLPEFDVRASYATRIAAPPERVYASLRTADFDHWGLMRALSALRALPAFPAAPRETWRRFREPAPPGTAKAAWNFAVGRRSDGATELRTETRVLCADVATRRRFRAYWTLIGPFSGLIRREMLAAVRSAAESTQRRIVDPPT